MINIYWLMDFMTALLLIILAIVCLGYIVYALSPNIKSWEHGVIKIFTFIFEGLYEAFTGKVVENKRIDGTFIFSDEELSDLKKRLDGHPYDTPILATYDIKDDNDISHIVFNALRMVKEYEDLRPDDLYRMCEYIIRQFILDKRGHLTEFYIDVASPTHLRISIPLSYHASCKLQEKVKKTTLFLETTQRNEDVKIIKEVKVPDNKDE